LGALAGQHEGSFVMAELRAVCGAFLIAVLMCDLTFDLPIWRAPKGDPIARDHALTAMTLYYRRITARGSLLATSVALVMLCMLTSVGYELLCASKGHLARFAVESSLAVGPIVLATMRTFPCARRLATGEGNVAARTKLASAIARDHGVALPAMLVYVATQLARV
jgi:hypothetical protein